MKSDINYNIASVLGETVIKINKGIAKLIYLKKIISVTHPFLYRNQLNN